MKIALVIFITLALAGCALLSLHMGVIPVPWRALLTDWQAGREHYYVLMEYRLLWSTKTGLRVRVFPVSVF